MSLSCISSRLPASLTSLTTFSASGLQPIVVISAVALFFSFSLALIWFTRNGCKQEKSTDNEERTVKVTKLIIYPIKSCAPVSLQEARVTARGLENDRLFMIIDSHGRSVTLRKEPRLALLRPSFDADGNMVLEAPQMHNFIHNIRKSGPSRIVQHFGAKSEATDQGDDVANYLERFMGEKWKGVRLMRMRDGFVRHVDSSRVTPRKFQASLADGWPYMIAGEESVDKVTERVGRDMDMIRFRPNIVVKGAQAFEEDKWKKIRIGSFCEFDVTKACKRCKIPTVDPQTGIYDVENQPTVALETFRKVGTTVEFGQYMVPTKNRRVFQREVERIRVGDAITVLKTGVRGHIEGNMK